MGAATATVSGRGGVTQSEGSTLGETGGVREKPLPPQYHAQLMSVLNPDRKYLK